MEFPTRGARRHGKPQPSILSFAWTTLGPITSLLPGLVLLVSPNAGDNHSAADSSGSASPRAEEGLAGTPLNRNSNPVRSTHETTVSQGATHPPSISMATDHHHRAVPRGACLRSGDRKFSLGERRWCS